MWNYFQIRLGFIYWWDGRGLMLWLFSDPLGFLLLRYSVLNTVESLSLLYLLFISWFICFWRWCIDSCKPNTYVSWSTSELRMRLVPWNRFKSSSKVFFSDPSKKVLLLWIICVFCVLCFSCFRVCSLLPYGHLLGKSWPLDSCRWCLLYFCYFPMWYPGSGVVLDCIVSWSLLSFLLLGGDVI